MVADTETRWKGAELGLGTRSRELDSSNKLEVTNVRTPGLQSTREGVYWSMIGLRRRHYDIS